jgi:hypothetical protein
MLSEIRHTRQVPGEGYRRWFTDEYFDLIVWYDDDAAFYGFQLCYDKMGRERALTWTRNHGFRHDAIDAGEVPGSPKMTPVIVADGEFSAQPIAQRFRQESASIDPELSLLVYDMILSFPAGKQGPPDLG